MPFDAHKNLAIATITIAPSPATSGTQLQLGPGEGARFPAVPFNATIWPAAQPPTPTNAEIVRVIFNNGVDGLEITRAQEGSTARAIVAGDLLAATITAKVITDIESGVNFPQLATTGSLTFTGAPIVNIATNTPDGADTRVLQVTAAGGIASSRGAAIALYGNEAPGVPGAIVLVAGDVPTGTIDIVTGAAATRGRMHRSGGFSWGNTFDPGAGVIHTGTGGTTMGTGWINLAGPSGAGAFSGVGSAAQNPLIFYNANGNVGSVLTSGSTTSFVTTSDARLKEDHGAAPRDLSHDVLARTVVHDFIWLSDGTPGRGVFAQEAVEVAPFAVLVGRDDTDDDGRLLQPWGVDYAKYIPDLIIGWQAHTAQIAALTATVAALEARLAALEAAAPPA